jgi:DNA polymerase III subunit epsilon
MNFVSIDFETAKYSRESACSVGLVKYQDGKAADTFYSLIRPPDLYIRPDFTEIHGLTVDDVKDAPTFAHLWLNTSALSTTHITPSPMRRLAGSLC